MAAAASPATPAMPRWPGVCAPVRDFRGWLWQEGRCIDARRTAGLRAPQLPLAALAGGGVPRCAGRQEPAMAAARPGPHGVAGCGCWGRATRRRSLTATRPAPRCRSRWPTCAPCCCPGERLTVQRAGEARPLFTLTGAAQDEPHRPLGGADHPPACRWKASMRRCRRVR